MQLILCPIEARVKHAHTGATDMQQTRKNQKVVRGNAFLLCTKTHLILRLLSIHAHTADMSWSGRSKGSPLALPGGAGLGLLEGECLHADSRVSAR